MYGEDKSGKSSFLLMWLGSIDWLTIKTVHNNQGSLEDAHTMHRATVETSGGIFPYLCFVPKVTEQSIMNILYIDCSNIYFSY